MPVTSTKVKLYLAKSFDELLKLGEVIIERNDDPGLHLNVANKAFAKAEELFMDCDEEKSFVLYMRYLNVIDKAKKTKNYAQNLKYKNMVIPSNMGKAIDKAEILKESLKKRYKEREDENSFTQQENKPTTNMNNDIAKISNKTSPYLDSSPFISSNDLYKLMVTKPPLAVILDCRESGDLKKGLIYNVPVIYKPPAISTLELTLTNIKNILKMSNYNVQLNQVTLVLMDNDSEELITKKDHPLIVLKQNLECFDTSNELSCCPKLLDGGFESWSLHFPTFVRLNDITQNNSFSPDETSSSSVLFPELLTHDDTIPEKENTPIDETVNSNDDFYKPRRAPPPIPPKPSIESQSDNGNDISSSAPAVSIIADVSDASCTKFSNSMDTESSLSGGHESSIIMYSMPIVRSNTLPSSNSLPPITSNSDSSPFPASSNQSIELGSVQPSAPPLHYSESSDPYSNSLPVSAPYAITQEPVNQMQANFNNLSLSIPTAYTSDTYITQSLPPQHTLPDNIQSYANNSFTTGQSRVIPIPPSYEESKQLPTLSPTPHPFPVSRSVHTVGTENTDIEVLSHDQMADNSLEMEITKKDLQAKEERVRQLESELENKNFLEEKILKLEQQKHYSQQELAEQLLRMKSDLAQEKNIAEQELYEKQRHFNEMQQKTKQHLLNEYESIKMEKQVINKKKDEIEQRENVLENEKTKLEIDKAQLKADKENFELLRKSVIEQQKQAQTTQADGTWHHLLQQDDTPTNQMNLNHGLPTCWRKLFDPTTGRFYYQDDQTKTTHWNPPTSWIVTQQPNIMQGMTKGALIGNFSQTPISGSNQPQQTPYEMTTASRVTNATPSSISITPSAPSNVVPNIDRSTKPFSPEKQTPEIPSRAYKKVQQESPYLPQIKARILAKSKSRTLQAVSGSNGRGLTGLNNLGNTCFMNSILQCLIATHPLSEYFLSNLYVSDINPINPLGMGGELAMEYAFVVQCAWKGTYQSIAPRDFKSTISNFAPQFSGSQQHDSQEFLAFLLDGLHEDLNKVIKKEYIVEPSNDGVLDETASKRSWDIHLRLNNSIIVDMLQGQFKSTLNCLHCSYKSVTFEAFMYLSVPIPSNNFGNCSLLDCIKEFSKVEKVSGANSWYCKKCKTHRDAAKTIDIWRLPPILLIHIKRFAFSGRVKRKMDTTVDFPLNNLNLSKFVASSQKLREYKLYAVSNHSGSIDSGHYTAYVKNPVTQTFFKFDDSQVMDMSTSRVQTRNGYVLFYTSIDTTTTARS